MAVEQRHSKNRAVLWRMAGLALVILPVPFLTWLLTSHRIAPPGACALLGAFILSAVIVTMVGEALKDRATLSDPDRMLLGRFRLSGLRLVLVMIAAGCFIPLGMSFLRQQFQASLMEAFIAVLVPYWLAIGLLRKRFPISAGTSADTMRAHALLIDRDRRTFVWTYTVYAALWVLEMASWLPQVARALHGQPVDLRQLHVVGIYGVSSLFMLYGPQRLFQNRALAAMAEDESLTSFRDQAFRHAFFTMALGMIGIFDLLLRNPKLATIMLPVLFGASQIAGFLTLAIQEHRAGRPERGDEDRDVPGSVGFRGTMSGI